MIRLSLIAALAGLLFCGCGRIDGGVADQAAAEGVGAAGDTPQEEAPAGNENAQVKTPLIRALIQTVDEAKGESPEVKDSLKRSLREADRELAEVLGGKSQQLIMKANKKPPMLVVGGVKPRAAKVQSVKAGPSEEAKAEKPKAADAKKPSGAAGGAEQPAEAKQPAETEQPGKLEQPARTEKPAETTPQDAPAEAAELKSPMVRALIQAVDDAEGEKDEVKDELKRLLREADKELSGVLGGDSKRMILKANKKPPVPVVGGDDRRGARVRRVKGVKIQEFKSAKPGQP